MNASELESANEILKRIESLGAEAVYQQLGESNRWGALLSKIETGDKSWLEVAVRLKSATDAGPSEMLILAAGVALANSPYNVLKIGLPTLEIEGVCGYPDMSDQQYDSKDKTLVYLNERIIAVTNLNQPDIAEKKTNCLEMLNKTKREVSSPAGPFSG